MLKPKTYTYKTNLKWVGERKGKMSSPGKPDIDVACPPEFGGHEGIWSPEDLFVASVELCIMTTFLWLADKNSIALKSYKSEAEGIAYLVDGIFRYAEVKVKPIVEVASEPDRKAALELFGEVIKWCMVTSSIIPEVKLEPLIEIC